MKMAMLTAAVLSMGTMAMASEQHTFAVWGHPQVFDVIPPTVPYVEISASTYANSSVTLNGGSVMSAGCANSIRLTREEAQELIERLQEWLIAPEDERLLFGKIFMPQASATPTGNDVAKSACNKGER